MPYDFRKSYKQVQVLLAQKTKSDRWKIITLWVTHSATLLSNIGNGIFIYTVHEDTGDEKVRGKKWKWFNINNSSLPPHVVCAGQIRRELLKNWKKNPFYILSFTFGAACCVVEGMGRGGKEWKNAQSNAHVFFRREKERQWESEGERVREISREREWDRKNTVRRLLLRAGSEGPK